MIYARHRLYYKVLPIFFPLLFWWLWRKNTFYHVSAGHQEHRSLWYFHSLQTIQWPFLSYRWGHCRPGHFCTTEMLHCRLKMIALNICVLICNNLFLLADTWTQTVLWKLSHWIYLLLRGSGFSFILSPIRMFIHSLMFTQEFKLWVNLGGSKDLIR